MLRWQSRRRKKVAISIALIASAVPLSSCSSSAGAPTQVSTAATAPTVDQETAGTGASASSSPAESREAKVDLAAFVDAIGSEDDPDAMRAALKLTAPGSSAEAYVRHLANVVESTLDGGGSGVKQTVERTGDSFKSCDDPGDESSCATFAGFKITPAGKISELTVNGKSIGDRITVGNGSAVTTGGAKFTFLTAYKSIMSNALFVTVKVKSGNRPISVNNYSAVYRSPDGKQRTATDAMGPTDIAADSSSIVTMVFKGVAVGGKVTMDGCVSECASSWSAKIRVG